MSIQNEDVYETEDLPEDEQHVQQEETHESEEVERVHLDVDAAMLRFKGRLLNADTVDFSESISRRRRGGYGSGAYVLEVVGRDYEQPETTEQRFHRLNYELNELAEQLLNEKEDAKTKVPGVSCENVIQMQEILKAMQLKKNAPTSEPLPLKQGRPAPKGDVATGIDPRLVAMEARLTRLEQFVGGSGGEWNGSKEAARATLSDAMEDLRMRVHSLNPNHVDALQSRLTQVLAKFDQVESKRLERVESDFEDKVNALYAMMIKWDEMCVGLPSIVQRMHGLQKLHEQAQQFSSRLSQLAGVRSQLQKAFEGEEMAMLDFREQTAATLDSLSADVKKLDERIQKVVSK